MDGWDSYDEGMDSVESIDSFDEGATETIDIDVSTTMDSVEPMEESLDYSTEELSFEEPEYVESVMDSVEPDEVVFDDDIDTNIEVEDSGQILDDVPQEIISETPEVNVDVIEDSFETNETEIENTDNVADSIDEAIPENQEDSFEDTDVKILTRDPEEQWEAGNRAIEDTLEVMRDDLRDKGIEDGEYMEQLIAQEQASMQEELANNINGDLSYHYDGPEWKDDPSILEQTIDNEVSDSLEETNSSVEWNEDGSITIGNLDEADISSEPESTSIDGDLVNTNDITETAEFGEEAVQETQENLSETGEPIEWNEDQVVSIEHTDEIDETNIESNIESESSANTLDVMNEVEAEEVEFEDEINGIEVDAESTDAIETTENVDAFEEVDTIQPNLENIEEVPDAHVALDNMSEYMNSHNYGLEDYETYSKDPEWQALNRELQAANGIDVNQSETIEGIDEQLSERVYDDFEQSVLENDPEFYETGSFYTQGVNSRGFEGTCGPTSQANAINKLLETNELTENKILDIAVDNNLCNLEGPAAGCGGTTTEQFMELYDKVNEQIGDKINTELYEFGNVLDANQVAERLDAGDVVNVAVDSSTLWGQSHGIADLLGVRRDVISDHWITVTGVNRAETGEIQGFDIIDSGGGENYVSLDKYNDMCFGTGSRIVKDPTCIVVSKKA